MHPTEAENWKSINIAKRIGSFSQLLNIKSWIQGIESGLS